MKVFAVVTASLATCSHATNSQQSTITKVVVLLQDMLAKSKTEGDQERALFAKFKCFCDQNEEEKTESIEKVGKDISVLKSKISELQGGTGGLSVESAQLAAAIDANIQAVNEATTIRNKANTAYLTEKADMESAIDQMNNAIETLSEVGADQTLGAAADTKQFMASQFLQSRTISSGARAALQAVSGFLEPAQANTVESFLQAEAPFTGTYTSQSGQVVGILKSMRDTFKANLAAATTAETQQLESHNVLVQTLVTAKTEMTASLASKQEGMGSNDGDLSAKEDQRDQAIAQKASDEVYLQKLLAMCEEKTNEYNERKMLRSQEDAAIAEAVAILNSDGAFETFGKGSATSFIQLRSRHVRVHGGVTPAQKQLKDVLLSVKSPRLEKIVAMVQTENQAENVFDVVLKEMAAMIEVIAEEEKADETKYEWCNYEYYQTEDEVDAKEDEKDTLSNEVTALTILINDPVTGLKAQIAATEASLLENVASQKSETKARAAGTVLYQEDIANLVAAQDILNKALKVLAKYYDMLAAKLAATAFLQEDPNAPTANFNAGGQSAAGGDAISALKFILAESIKEEKAAHTAEEASQTTYEDSMQGLKTAEAGSQKSLANLHTLTASKEEELLMKTKELKTTQAELDTLEAWWTEVWGNYHNGLNPTECTFLWENFRGRTASRTAETAALNQAIVLIKATPTYQNFKASEKTEGFGDCSSCNTNENHVECKACMAKVTKPAYCAGHAGTEGC